MKPFTQFIVTILPALALLVLSINYARWRLSEPPQQIRPEATIGKTIYVTNTVWGTVPKTNFFDNGLGGWLADTNHTFGPKAAKSIHVMQFPDGKFYLRWLEDGVFSPLFESDRGYSTDHAARSALMVNIDLMMKKALCDAVEDAFRGIK